MSNPKRTKEENIVYPKTIAIDENGSDFVGTVKTFQKSIISQFGNDIVKLAVDQLRGEFNDMAVEAARQGAMMALQGDDVMELEMKVAEAERELTKLKTQKEELEYQLRQEKTTNKDLEDQIRNLDDQISKKAKRVRDMICKLKDLKEAEKARNKTEKELRSEILKHKEEINKLKGKLLVKASAGNVAKDEIPKLRAKITELEDKLSNGKMK